MRICCATEKRVCSNQAHAMHSQLLLDLIQTLQAVIITFLNKEQDVLTREDNALNKFSCCEFYF